MGRSRKKQKAVLLQSSCNILEIDLESNSSEQGNHVLKRLSPKPIPLGLYPST